MKSTILAAAFLALILGTAAALGQAVTYQFDTQNSAANFTVRHMLVANVRGQFTGLKGALEFDEKDVAKSRVDATLDAATVTTGIAPRDNDLRSPNFFDVAQFPTITFRSTKAESAGPGKMRVTGDLTMHGVTRSVVLDVEGPTPPVKSGPMTRIGMVATTRLNRKDFGLTWNRTLDNGGAVVADEVAIELDLEFVNRPAAPAAK